jgi:uncharacterized lipoprotein YajG
LYFVAYPITPKTQKKMARSVMALLLAVFFMAGCTKENNNKVPTADAGPRKTLMLRTW